MAKIPGIHSKTSFFIEASWATEQDRRNFPNGMEFKLPYKKGSKNIAVIAIKRFFGLDASSGDFFDEITKANLVAFQDENRQTLMDIAGYLGEDDSTLRYRSELGVINGPTWTLIMAAGEPNVAASMSGFPTHIQPPANITLKDAIKDTFRALESNRLLMSDPHNSSPIRTIQDNLDASDKEEPPYADGDYYYYTFHSQATRAQVNRENPDSYKDMLLETSERALREGTKKVLEYYNKPLEWIVNTERESDLALYGEILRFNNRALASSTVTVGDVGSLERRDFTRDIQTVHTPDDWDYTQDPPGPDQPHIVAHGARKLERELANEDPDGSGFAVPGALTSFGDSNHLLTINELPILEALNVSRIENQEYSSKVDVLFGQPLFEGSEPFFAAIHKVHSPKLRPGSAFKFTIKVKKKLLDGIPRDISAKEMVDTNLRSIETVVGVAETIGEVYQVGSKAVDYLRRKTAQEVADDAGRAAKKYINKFYRDGEFSDKAKQMIGNELELATGIVGLFGPSEEQKKAFEASIAANSVGMESLPCARDYKSQTAFQSSIIKVTGFLRQLSTRLRSKPNPPNFKPNINLSTEAGKLQAAGLALLGIVSTQTNAGFSGKFRVGFDIVRRRQTITVRKADGTVLTQRKVDPSTGQAEIVPVKKTIVVTKGMYMYALGTPKEGITVSGPALIPINYGFGPRTVAYLYNLMNMAKDVENPFCDQNQRVAGVQYITRYTFPTPTVLASGPMLGGDTFSIDAFFAGPIKTATDKLKEDISVLATDPKKALWKEGVVKVERGKTYDILPRVPKDMLCTIDQLYLELLKKLDLRTLFCNFIECVPEIPFPTGFEDMSFDIPEIPDLPSFDPLEFIIPYLRALIIDIIIAILCALARYFISLLQIPNCQDVILFAARKYNYYFGDNDKADTVAKASKALAAMDIPTDSLADVSNSLDDVAGALSPAEFISLLKGDPSDEVLQVTDRVLQSRANSFSESISGPSDIRDFFELMGSVVDDDVANRISNYPSVILGDIPCADDFIPSIEDMAEKALSGGFDQAGDTLLTPPRKKLRDRLLDAKATDEEIDKALIDAAKNREALKEIMAAGSENGGLINIPPAGCPEQGGLPGPYDNQNFRNIADTAVTAIYTDIKTFFNNDMRAYVPTFYGPHSRPLGPNDPEYDHVAMAEYDFVMRQVEYILSLSNSDDEDAQELSTSLWLRIMKPGTIVNEEGTFKARIARAGDSTSLRVIPREKEKDQKRKGNQSASQKYKKDHLFELGDRDSGPDRNKLAKYGIPNLANFVMSPGDPIVLPNIAIKPANNPERSNVALQASAEEKGAKAPAVIKYEVYDMSKKSDQDEFARVLMRPMDSVKNEVSILPRIRKILLDQKNFRAETSNSPYYHLDIEFMLSSLSQALGGTRDKYGIISSRDTGVALLATIFGVSASALADYMNANRYKNSGDVVSHYWNLLISLWHQTTATSKVSPVFPDSADIMRKAIYEGPDSVRGKDLMHQVLTDIMNLPASEVLNENTSILALNGITAGTLDTASETVENRDLLTGFEYANQTFPAGEIPDTDGDDAPGPRFRLTKEQFKQKELSEFAKSCFLKFVSVLDNLQNAITSGDLITYSVTNEQGEVIESSQRLLSDGGFDLWWESVQGSNYNYKKDSKIYIKNDVDGDDADGSYYPYSEEYKKIRMPDSWKILFLEISNIVKSKIIMNVRKHFKISIGGMIEKAQHHIEKSQIHMAELPYTGQKQDIRDCYLVSRWGSSPYYNIAGKQNPLYAIRHEVFTEEVKDDYKNKRIDSLDLKYTQNAQNLLLRPGAYAGVLFDKAKNLYLEGDIIDHNMLNRDNARQIINNAFDPKDENNNPSSLSDHMPWQYLTNRTDLFGQDSVYAKTVDRLMDKMAYEIANSKYFETDEMSFLSNRITNVKKYVYFLKDFDVLNREYLFYTIGASEDTGGGLKANDGGLLVHHSEGFFVPEMNDGTSPEIMTQMNLWRAQAEAAKIVNARYSNMSEEELLKEGVIFGAEPPGYHNYDGYTEDGDVVKQYNPIEVSDYQYREAIRGGKFKTYDFARCMIQNKPVIDFDKVKEEALKSFFNSLCREEYSPVNRDFTKQGPLEIEIQGQLVILYMKTYVYEFLLNGIFMFGNMSAGGLFDSEFVKSYIVDSVLSTISKDFDEDRGFQVSFLDKLKYLLNEDNSRIALKKMVTSITSEVINELTQIADDVFQPDFSSFKEQFFNELAADFLDGGRYFEEQKYKTKKTRGRFVQGDLFVDFDGLTKVIDADEDQGPILGDITLPVTYKNHPSLDLYELDATSISLSEAGFDPDSDEEDDQIFAKDLRLSEGVSNQINQEEVIRKNARAQYARNQALELPIAGFGDISQILNMEDPSGNSRYKYNTAATLARGGFYLEKYFKLDRTKLMALARGLGFFSEEPPLIGNIYHNKTLANMASAPVADEAAADNVVYRNDANHFIKRSSAVYSGANVFAEPPDDFAFKAFTTFKLNNTQGSGEAKHGGGINTNHTTSDARLGFGDGLEHPMQTFFKMKYWSPSDVTKLWNLVTSDLVSRRDVEDENGVSLRGLCNDILRTARIGIRLVQVMPEIYDKKTTRSNYNPSEATPTIDLRIKSTTTNTSNVNDLSFVNRKQDIDNLFMQSEFMYPYKYSGRLGSFREPQSSDLANNIYGNFSTSLKSDIAQMVMSVDAYAIGYAKQGELNAEGGLIAETDNVKEIKRNIFRRTSFKLSGINRIHKCGAMIWSPSGTAERYPLKIKDINVYENTTNKLDKYNDELSKFRRAYSRYYKEVIEDPIKSIQSFYANLPAWFSNAFGDGFTGPDTTNLRERFLGAGNFVSAGEFGTLEDLPALAATGNATYALNGTITSNVNEDNATAALQAVKEYRGINKNISEISQILTEDDTPSTGVALHSYGDSLALNTKKIKFTIPLAEYDAGTINLSPDQENCPVLGNDGLIDSTRIEKLAEKYNNKLLKGLLGLGKEKITVNNSVVRKLENYQSANADVKYLFDFVFPLDRYQDLFFIHNEALVKQAISIQDHGYLEPTRGAIRRQYRILENVPGQDKASQNFNFSQEEFAEILRNAEDGKGPNGGEGPDMLKDIGLALIRIAIMTPISIVRGLSIMLDPAYAQMKTLMETDSCKLRKGLLWPSIGLGGVYPKGIMDGAQVNGGVGPNCNNRFHPLPWAAIPDVMLSVKDIVLGLTMFLGFPPFVYPPLIIKGADTLANTLLHIKGAITFSSERSYGSILGPAGMIALSLPEVPGEAYKMKHKNAGCAERSDPCEDGIELPETMDICEFVKDDLEQKQEELQSQSQSGGEIV